VSWQKPASMLTKSFSEFILSFLILLILSKYFDLKTGEPVH